MFTGNENHIITLEEGAEMTKRYRQTIAMGERLGAFFGSRDMQLLLNQAGCVGFRYYYGLNSNNEKVLVLVGTDANEDDLVNGLILDLSTPCPNQCGTPNALNADMV